jgi:tRNA A-37 threonylcarbamoyl transferase component Bud32
MSFNLDYSNKVLYNKLNQYFNNNIKLSLKTENKLFIITNNDVFYEIKLYDQKIPKFVLADDKEVIESMIVEELSNKKVIDLCCGHKHYVTRTIDNEYYFMGENKLEVNEIISGLNIADVKCGVEHTMILTESGEVYVWGNNSQWQIGNGTVDDQLIPIKLDYFDEKIAIISCGAFHSMALTKSGSVYGWGRNTWETVKSSNPDVQTLKPKLIELNKIVIEKISCCQTGSFLLSNDGVVYEFGESNTSSGPEVKVANLVKLNHDNNFIDIASHFNKKNFLFLYSRDNFYYVLMERESDGTKISKTNFQSFYDAFSNHSIQYKVSKNLLEFEDSFFRLGYYDEKYEEIQELGSGSYGTVFKARGYPERPCAIKKIRPKNISEKEFLNEHINFSIVSNFKNEFILEHKAAWFEHFRDKVDENTIFFIEMELCETTLEDVIGEIEKDINFEKNEILTPIGYFLASKLFNEILEGVYYLHQIKIIHRDLKPSNILIKKFNDGKCSVKIADFGFATVHEFSKQPHSQDKGTPKYTAPEVISSNFYGTKSDIYSLGIVFGNLFNLFGYRQVIFG